MRAYHKEIDELRRRGDLKEALDLARYAHSERRTHRLIKRSYAWAIYSYLKLKVQHTLDHPELMSDLSAHQSESTRPLMSDHPRRREINTLCREYRTAKLLTSDLCLSLILGQLCRLSPPPLGLFGLVRWAKMSVFRDEDHTAPPDRPELTPLSTRVTRSLSTLVSYLDHERIQRGADTKIPVDPSEIASLIAQLARRDDERRREVAPMTSRLSLLNTTTLYTLCWTYRRASEFDESLAWTRLYLMDHHHPSNRASTLRQSGGGERSESLEEGAILVQRPHDHERERERERAHPPTSGEHAQLAEVWWEAAQSVAMEAHIPDELTPRGLQSAQAFIRSLDEREVSSRRLVQLNEARACAIHATHIARGRGVLEADLAPIYARVGLWSMQMREHRAARAFFWWSIEASRHASRTTPYTWSLLLEVCDETLGEARGEPWEVLRIELARALDLSMNWLTREIAQEL